MSARPPSHLRPRTRTGRLVVRIFFVVLLLAQPPVLWLVANRVQPWILGLPFLYAWLLGVYVVLNGILIWGWRKGL